MSGLRERLAERLYLANGFAWYGRDLGDWRDPESRVARGERDRWLGQADALLPLIAAERDEAARQARAEVVARVESALSESAADGKHVRRAVRAALTEARDE